MCAFRIRNNKLDTLFINYSDNFKVSIMRDRATTTHYTHHQVSLMVRVCSV